MSKPFPIFDSVEIFQSGETSQIRSAALNRISKILLSQNCEDHNWISSYYDAADDFLHRYIEQGKSVNTFRRFRSEIERYTLWLVLKAKLNPMEVAWQHVVGYADFLKSPDREWISPYRHNRLTHQDSMYAINSEWRPFWAKAKAGERRARPGTEKRKIQDQKAVDLYSASQATIDAALRALGPFYKYLIDRELKLFVHDSSRKDLISPTNSAMITVSPIPDAVKQVKKNSFPSGTNENSKILDHRLNNRQWLLVKEAAETMAKSDPHRWTRALFILIFAKASFLSVSEICKSKTGVPAMGQIRYDSDTDAWFFFSIDHSGSERKVRIPKEVMPYLSLYRKQRGADNSLPDPSENMPILAKIGPRNQPSWEQLGVSGIKVVTACDDIRTVLTFCIKNIRSFRNFEPEFMESDLRILNKASSLWLRNTGLCDAIEGGEKPKDVFTNFGKIDYRTTLISYFELTKKDFD